MTSLGTLWTSSGCPLGTFKPHLPSFLWNLLLSLFLKSWDSKPYGHPRLPSALHPNRWSAVGSCCTFCNFIHIHPLLSIPTAPISVEARSLTQVIAVTSLWALFCFSCRVILSNTGLIVSLFSNSSLSSTYAKLQFHLQPGLGPCLNCPSSTSPPPCSRTPSSHALYSPHSP